LPLYLSDREEEIGFCNSAEIHRCIQAIPRLDHLARLRGHTLAEEECGRVAQTIRTLLGNPLQMTSQAAGNLERELSAALGPPRCRGDFLTLLDPNGNLDALRLCEQYDFQVVLLASLDLLEAQNGHMGITGIDARFHPLPPVQDIQARLETPELRRKIAQGFNQLLLVPFGVSLAGLLDAWRRNLLRSITALP
jgi:hypothetical protein